MMNSVAVVGDGPMQRESSCKLAFRAALDAGLTEMGAQLSDLGGLDVLTGTDIDLDPLGVEFDLSTFQETDGVVSMGSPSPPTVVEPKQREDAMPAPAGVPAGNRGGDAAVIVGGEPLSRDPSFGISGHAAASSIMGSGLAPGETLSRQSSLDINAIMQARGLRGV